MSALDPVLRCVICGRPVGDEVEDQPDWATGPMCAECYRNRELDNDIWYGAMRAEQDAENDVENLMDDGEW